MWIQENYEVDSDEKEKETRYKKKGKILRQVKRYGWYVDEKLKWKQVRNVYLEMGLERWI